jgi:hypothetical protein
MRLMMVQMGGIIEAIIGSRQQSANGRWGLICWITAWTATNPNVVRDATADGMVLMLEEHV